MEAKKSKKKIYTILLVEIFIVCMISVFFFIDFRSFNFFDDENFQYITSESPCDLRTSTCTIEVNKNHKVSLNISPKGIPLMTNLTFDLYAPGINTNSFRIKIYAINMQMGSYTVDLKKEKNYHYKGIQALPTCIIGDMIWNADVTSSALPKNTALRFTFKTEK